MTRTMKHLERRNICVYCASDAGSDVVYTETAIRLGHAIAEADLGLVYGGGANGLMGSVARAAFEKGGQVTGIIPDSLREIGSGLHFVSTTRHVSGYHERKALMCEISDAFVALPGGPGTLEEVIEQIAWASSGLHAKPVFLINVRGYWNPLEALLEQMANEPGLGGAPVTRPVVVDEPEEAVAIFLRGQYAFTEDTRN
jgi:uncharacterized protein (TIGR00730 family)